MERNQSQIDLKTILMDKDGYEKFQKFIKDIIENPEEDYLDFTNFVQSCRAFFATLSPEMQAYLAQYFQDKPFDYIYTDSSANWDMFGDRDGVNPFASRNRTNIIDLSYYRLFALMASPHLEQDIVDRLNDELGTAHLLPSAKDFIKNNKSLSDFLNEYTERYTNNMSRWISGSNYAVKFDASISDIFNSDDEVLAKLTPIIKEILEYAKMEKSNPEQFKTPDETAKRDTLINDLRTILRSQEEILKKKYEKMPRTGLFNTFSALFASLEANSRPSEANSPSLEANSRPSKIRTLFSKIGNAIMSFFRWVAGLFGWKPKQDISSDNLPEKPNTENPDMQFDKDHTQSHSPVINSAAAPKDKEHEAPGNDTHSDPSESQRP
ncbi:MAG: hypothetical protein V4490_08195 [Pseudomonadota bacterium]